MAPPPPPSDHLESPQTILDEISEEILLRLPPDDPSCLARPAAVCKRWRRLVAHPNFLRRLHELYHRRPLPLLGLFQSDYVKPSTGSGRLVPTTRFIPTTPSAFSLPIPDSRGWKVLNYRHGRVLFSSQVTEEGQDFLIWEPITGDQRLVPVPGAPKSMLVDAAVVCAADGCDHRHCHGGPFRLVFLYIVRNVNLTYACAYLSESGSWGKVYAVVYEPVKENSSVLVGQSRICFLSGFDRILEYDWTSQPCLSVIDLPDTLAALKGIIGLVLTRERELGVAGVKEACLYLWSREASDKGEFQSTIRIIELHNMLPAAALSASQRLDVLGFAEDANVIFLNTNAGVFAIDLEPERARKVCETHKSCRPLIPFSSFYIPGKRVAAAGGGEGTS